MRRSWVSRSAFLACLWLAVPAATFADTTRIDFHDGLLSAQIGELPLAEVLRRAGEQAGITVTVIGDLGAARPQQFDSVPLAEAIRRLVGEPHLLLMIYRTRQGAEGEAQLDEIRVYAASADPSGPTATVVTEPGVPERSVRMTEIRELLQQRDPAAVRRLAQHLAGDPDPDVRRIAAGALTSIGGEESAAALERALRDRDAVVRLQAARSLRRLLGADAAAALGELARADDDAEVRRTAVILLSGLDGPQVTGALEGALADPSADVREAAERVLDAR